MSMTYEQYIVALNSSDRTDDMPLNVLVAARIIDMIDPGNLGITSSGLPTHKGALVGGMNDVTPILGIPGVACRNAPAGENGNTVPMPISAPFTGQFSDADVAGVAGPGLTVALDAVAALLQGAAAQSGLLTQYELQRIGNVLAAGGWCAPTASGTEGARYASNPQFATAWAALGGQFDAVRGQYLRGQYTAAAAAAQASAANVAFWNTVYTSVQTVQQLPAIAVNAVTDAAASTAKSILGALSFKSYIVLAVVGIGAMAFLVGPSTMLRFFKGSSK